MCGCVAVLKGMKKSLGSALYATKAVQEWAWRRGRSCGFGAATREAGGRDGGYVSLVGVGVVSRQCGSGVARINGGEGCRAGDGEDRAQRRSTTGVARC